MRLLDASNGTSLLLYKNKIKTTPIQCFFFYEVIDFIENASRRCDLLKKKKRDRLSYRTKKFQYHVKLCEPSRQKFKMLKRRHIYKFDSGQ